jgi:restriction system protein
MATNYTCEVSHKELGKHQILTGTDKTALEGEANALKRTWNAQAALEQIRNILLTSLSGKHTIDWQKLKMPEGESMPGEWELLYKLTKKKPKPVPPVYLEYPLEPQRTEPRYQALDDYTVREYIYVRDYEKWAEKVKEAETENQRRYDESAAEFAEWDAWTAEQIREKVEYNEAMIKAEADYKAMLPTGIANYCKLVLAFSNYPINLRREFNTDYIPETKVLVVDYSLPAPEQFPHIKEVKYVKTRNEFVDVHLSENELIRFYDDALYQTSLAALHALFDSDVMNVLDMVVFNGWVKSVDKTTGRDTNGCVLSVQARKDEFQKINLARVEPRACFKALKGIGSSTLHSLTPIAPVLKINRDDKRFVASHEVAGQLDERFNLAAMDWEDFEHLIRELFEKEFSKPGCEVKVTQASRDGGVDSVVFDPDPIHGGKTVIQAKRYTNTVGVAAVRELYGTVLNEGAMKGILVTTADYGPDAYEFAADKPLVLLNGANLLSLLEKHGHKAKIDLQEAKRILGEKV